MLYLFLFHIHVNVVWGDVKKEKSFPLLKRAAEGSFVAWCI